MIKYQYRSKLLRIKDKTEFFDKWSDELFLDRKLLEENLDKEIQDSKKQIQNKYPPHIIPISYEIKEVEINKLTVEELVDDYGSYEDYTVMVGDERIRDIIIDKFRGQKIRVSIEVIE